MIAPASHRKVNEQTQTSYTVARAPGARLARAWRFLASLSWCAASVACAALGSGCSDSDGVRATLPESTPRAGGSQWAETVACVEGETEPCSVMLGEHAGIVSCYEGTRTCRGGVFGVCEDGRQFEVTSPAAPASHDLGLLALSDPSGCTNNPCNSYCREFDEVPMNGIRADVDPFAPPLSSWNTGNLSEYPPEWVVVGVTEPCHIAGDCQFDTFCSDPALGSCSHSVCAAGDPLALGCNRCADAVCAIEPNCCGTPAACVHDPCEGTGPPLDRGCDQCVAAVCDVHPECCDVSWNDACVGYVATECASLGQSCGCPEDSVESGGTCYATGRATRDWGLARDACNLFGSAWTLIQVDSPEENAVALDLMREHGLSTAWLGGTETGIDEWSWQRSGEVFFIADAGGGALQPGYTFANWAPGEPELGVAGRGLAMDDDGLWRDEQPNAELDYVCEGPPNRLGPQQSALRWSEDCVALVKSECGVECPDDVALGLGACVARVSTELDPSCPSFDLALGATCEDAGVPQIPVCNHGQTEAPAGLRLAYLPSINSDLSAATECILSDPIPPGRCISVTDCPGLSPGDALIVNPEDGSENTDECRLDDNWTIYQPVPCRTPVCEAGVFDAGQVQGDACRMPIEHPLTLETADALVTLSAGAPEPGCAASELRWGASCYFFSTDIRTWDAAQDRCRSRGTGWDLVALNSPAEQSWVRSESDPLRDVQIGLNDLDSEGNHVWSNGTCRSFDSWSSATGEPNDFPAGTEQCVRMTALSGGQWEDKPCSDGEHPYVCEGPVQNARGACAAGQLAGPDGLCYAFSAAGVSWTEARDACQALGAGWSLPVIDGFGVNEFVTSLVGCTPTWLNNPPGALANWAPAESVDLSQAPYLDEIGLWHTATDATPRARLCQGPPAASTPTVLTRVAGSSACTGGTEFYFEGSAAAPESITLCPSTCSFAAAVPDRRIDVEIPCAPPSPPAIETTVSELYEADCEDGGVIWDFFYYDTVTPADSRIDFEIRTAPSEADLPLATFVPIASAAAIPTNTQTCEISPPSCPIDIFTLLGSPAQQHPYLELRVRLFPGTNGENPLLRDWRVRFSCPPSQ